MHQDNVGNFLTGPVGRIFDALVPRYLLVVLIELQKSVRYEKRENQVDH